MMTNDDRGGGVKITENLLTSYVKKAGFCEKGLLVKALRIVAVMPDSRSSRLNGRRL